MYVFGENLDSLENKIALFLPHFLIPDVRIFSYLIQIIFASALAGLVSTKLDYQSTSPYCYLNTSGQVCIFTYISAAEIIFFALALLIPLVWVSQRNKWQSPAPILGLYLSLALFTVFWSFVMALTITARGGQATDAGLPQQSARTAAIGLAWTSTAVTALICVAVFTDL